ncbi:hypothetical protein P4637_18770 [Halalkalibacterium halodurans]|uniref:hypothetical protein n=1 Tax=Halalkalibacterium halodurans TaxID=86665 RepID=UPI002E2400C5|nr:hypothetical protein [Halalkalibacterium halodurans]MED4086860.1 hypothetical protein [Halalkalibacterium halodurans]MED4105932.1 hypothetical protein [Halalkalibacterium halodurans]MED4110737.1 hypothetical protein [Halalkalibacterium halodurans]MED4150690.1 hypothetical protein [Halalkalibacterium halodurans]
MELKEFKDRILMGEEFQFYFKDQSYWISQNENGYFLTREHDGYSQSFKSVDDLFRLGIIQGKTLEEIFDVIDI